MCAGRRRANHNPSRASVNTRPSASAWRRRLQRRAGEKQLTGGLRGRGGGAVLCSFGNDAALARCCKRSFADLLLTLGCFLEGSCGLLRKGREEGQIRSNLGAILKAFRKGSCPKFGSSVNARIGISSDWLLRSALFFSSKQRFNPPAASENKG